MMMGNNILKYVIKFVAVKDNAYENGKIITTTDAKHLAEKLGAIFETSGEFLIISNYRFEPMLFCRRYD